MLLGRDLASDIAPADLLDLVRQREPLVADVAPGEIDRITPTHRFGGAETRGRNGGLVEAVLNIHRTCPSPSCSLAENGPNANRSLASQVIKTAVEVPEPVADRVALIDRTQHLGSLEID